MRHLPLPTLLLALSLLPVGLAAPALAADTARDVTSAISSVTVYPDRAQITRSAHVELTPGTYVLRFNRLPENLMADSVRVGGSGTASVMVHSFDLKTKYLGDSPDKQVAKLNEQKARLEDEDRGYADERAMHQRQLELLIQTAKRSDYSLSNQLANGRAKLAEWQALFSFMKGQQLGEARAIQDLDRKRAELAKRREKLDAALAKLEGFQQKAVKQVPVTVEVTKGGTLDLDLEYVVPGARWTPSYDARLDNSNTHLDWRFYGVVSQKTGEDWNGVRLRLSTARPASGTQPPALPGWFLSLARPEEDEAPSGAMARPAAPPMAQNYQAAAPKPMRKALPPAEVMERKDVAEVQASVSDQGSSVTLDVPREVSIPSDGEPHQTPVGHAAFVPKPSYRLLPRLSQDAYLMVETVQAGPWPLLPGPVKAFVGQDYVGTTMLQTDIVPGQRFSLPLGVDRGVQVKRQRLAKNVGEEGLLKKNGFAEYKYELLVSNFKPTPQTVQVVEPVPQSTEEAIRIRVDAGALSPMANSAPGQIRWEFKLQPNEKKQLKWGYKVEFPAGATPQGLE